MEQKHKKIGQRATGPCRLRRPSAPVMPATAKGRQQLAVVLATAIAAPCCVLLGFFSFLKGCLGLLGVSCSLSRQFLGLDFRLVYQIKSLIWEIRLGDQIVILVDLDSSFGFQVHQFKPKFSSLLSLSFLFHLLFLFMFCQFNACV